MIVFDLSVAPLSECEQYEDEADIDTHPIMCSLCGSTDLKPQHARPIVT
jgi:hypothetical protein